MNRFVLHISWIDAQIVSQTLDSIQNALQYSSEPTEFLFFLNEQTTTDTPLEKTPKECWEHFIHHPFINQVKIIYKTNDDPPFGVSQPRRDWMIRDGVNYWGESDCLLPLEYFYVAENFHKMCEGRPYILTFSERKMWEGWELHELVSLRKQSLLTLDKNIPEQAFFRCDGPMDLKTLYEFNEKQGDPKIEILPIDMLYNEDGRWLVRNSIEGTLCILSDQMPQNILCPDLVLSHDDACLQWSRNYYRIPQYHVSNILKGHDNWNPKKRTNIEIGMKDRSDGHKKFINSDREAMGKWVRKLYAGEIK
jgi:hypothetical protein